MKVRGKKEKMIETTRFEDLGLSQNALKAIRDLGYQEATEIQTKAIPSIIKGRDLIGNSHTGSGKTAAFVIPALERIDLNDPSVQVLVLCPTRELALQITDEIKKMSKYMTNVRSLAVYGGEPIVRQIKELRRGVQVVAGTPGRVMDHLRRKTLKTDKIKMLVLDEADEMLNMGFRDDMETIIKDIPKDRQTTLFSATMSRGILEISKEYLNSPEHIKVKNSASSLPKIEQSYFETRNDSKNELLSRIIFLETPDKALVFCNTKARVDLVVNDLQSKGIKAECIHGDITQSTRTEIMRRFKKGMFNVLVATDVAARGIDVDDISIVFNYDIPIDKEYYIHRIGRTARAGKEGRSYTFVSGRGQMRELDDIMRFTKSTIKKKRNPSNNEINNKRIKTILSKVEQNIGKKDDKHSKIIEEMFGDKYSHADIASALLKTLMENDNASKAGIEENSFDNEISRFHVNLGRKDSVDKSKIIEFITKGGGIEKKDIGKLDLYKTFTYVDIPTRLERKVLSGMKNEFHNGRRVKIEPALKKEN